MYILLTLRISNEDISVVCLMRLPSYGKQLWNSGKKIWFYETHLRSNCRPIIFTECKAGVMHNAFNIIERPVFIRVAGNLKIIFSSWLNIVPVDVYIIIAICRTNSKIINNFQICSYLKTYLCIWKNPTACSNSCITVLTIKHPEPSVTNCLFRTRPTLDEHPFPRFKKI